MSHLVVVAVAALALAVPGVAAGASTLQLDLRSVGEGARATWKAHAGQPDPTSNKRGDHALVLQKRVATATFGAAIADVEGIAGTAVTALAKVQWNRRSETHCSATSPRWVLSISEAGGAQATVVLGCALATLANGNLEGWWMDYWGADAIRAQVLAQAGEAGLNGTLSSLSIVFDEGPASVVIDNIIVTTGTAEGRWYGPGG